jgi:hypothetical protein
MPASGRLSSSGEPESGGSGSPPGWELVLVLQLSITWPWRIPKFGKRIFEPEPQVSQGSQPDHLHLIWFLCGGARFRVRDERVEVRVTVKRFKVRVFIYAESVTWRQTVIHGLA